MPSKKCPRTVFDSARKEIAAAICVLASAPCMAAWPQACGDAPPSNLTLKVAISRAICIDPSLEQTRAAARQSEALRRERRAALAPNLVMSATPLAAVQRAEGATSRTQSAEAAVSLSYTLADGGARKFRINQSENDVAAKEFATQASLIDAQHDFILLWADIRDADAEVIASVKADESAQASLALAQARFVAGSATRVDVLSAQSSVAQTRRDLLSAGTQLRKSKGLLAQRLGWSPGTEIMLQGDDDAILVGSLPASRAGIASLAEQLRHQHPQLAQQRSQTESLIAALDATRAEGRPTLKLTGQVGPTWSRNSNVASGSYSSGTLWNAQAGLTWSMQLSDGGATDARIAQVAAQLDAGRAQEDLQFRSLAENLWQRYAEWQDADASVAASQAALESAVATETAQRGRYRAGVGTIIDLLTAQSDLAQRQRQAAQALQQRLRARAGLLHALGDFKLQ
jgi:outer membrane protein